MKKFYGHGICDIKGDASMTNPNRVIYCTWQRMLDRCYSNKAKDSYIGTVVCDEWKYYSKFKEWYLINYKEGYQLDKDIIGGSKKIYSPETCAFVPKELNYCILDSAGNASSYGMGVIYRKRPKDMVSEYSKPYCAKISLYNKTTYLGVYATPEEAHRAWQLEKKKYIEKLIELYKNDVIPEVIDGLQKRVDILKNDIESFNITLTINKI